MLSIKNVVVGISGGVDSAVAALMLKKKGFNVIGLFMKNWDVVDEYGQCTGLNDFEDAKYVCNRLNIPLREVSFVKEYWNYVFESFMTDYQNGLTPNPDILCNKFIKFKSFYHHAIENLGADAIATGHYARTSFGDFLENYEDGVNVKLLKPRDQFKDQTFFLGQVPQNALRRTMFPLADFLKESVKKIAFENGLEKIAKKPESVGICFIGSRKFKQFMSEYVDPKPGKFVDLETAEVVGFHQGIHLYTLGQKCRIGGLKTAHYVAYKVPGKDEILVTSTCHHPCLYSSLFLTEKPYWIDKPLDLSYKENLEFRFLHGRPLTNCELVEFKSGGLAVKIEKPLRALTPGQYAVFYKGNECLGSARITAVGPSEFSLGNKVSPDYIEYEVNLDYRVESVSN